MRQRAQGGPAPRVAVCVKDHGQQMGVHPLKKSLKVAVGRLLKKRRQYKKSVKRMSESDQCRSSKAGGVDFRCSLFYNPGVALRGFLSLGRDLIADVCLGGAHTARDGSCVQPIEPTSRKSTTECGCMTLFSFFNPNFKHATYSVL